MNLTGKNHKIDPDDSHRDENQVGRRGQALRNQTVHKAKGEVKAKTAYPHWLVHQNPDCLIENPAKNGYDSIAPDQKTHAFFGIHQYVKPGQQSTNASMGKIVHSDMTKTITQANSLKLHELHRRKDDQDDPKKEASQKAKTKERNKKKR